MRKTLLLVTVFVLATLTLAQADTIVTTRPSNETDSVNWSQLGPLTVLTPIHNPFSFTTASSVSGTGSFAGSAEGDLVQQSFNWGGNFTPGDFLVWTNSQGPLTLTFSQGYSQVGAQIQTSFPGNFVAQICDNGNGQCFSEAGVTNTNADGSAIYIGIAGTNINSITYSVLSCAANCNPNDFAINQMTLRGGISAVPEPSSPEGLLLGGGLLGLVEMVRRKLHFGTLVNRSS